MVRIFALLVCQWSASFLMVWRSLRKCIRIRKNVKEDILRSLFTALKVLVFAKLFRILPMVKRRTLNPMAVVMVIFRALFARPMVRMLMRLLAVRRVLNVVPKVFFALISRLRSLVLYRKKNDTCSHCRIVAVTPSRRRYSRILSKIPLVARSCHPANSGTFP